MLFYAHADDLGMGIFYIRTLVPHILNFSIYLLQYADPKMAGLIKEVPDIFGSVYCKTIHVVVWW